MLNADQKKWDDPKKIKARYDTIIAKYRVLFSNSLPADRQYWTMCGQNAYDGQIIVGSELHQILQSELITDSQFHGVEINSDIYKMNVAAASHIHWYNMDFYRAMVLAKINNNFHPGIINADFTASPITQSKIFSHIMEWLTICNCDNLMLVGNFNLKMFCNKFAMTGNDIIKELNKHYAFQNSISKWHFENEYYEYAGTGDNQTIMGTIIFYRKNKNNV